VSHSINPYLITLSALLGGHSEVSATPPKELVAPVTRQPVEAKRPRSLVGRWCGLGLCVHLSASGATRVHHAPGTQVAQDGAQEGKPLERGLWWVEGSRLCLSAGLESACEPYQINPKEGSLTLKGVTLKRQAPESAQR
jgi:hypothetical protein